MLCTSVLDVTSRILQILLITFCKMLGMYLVAEVSFEAIEMLQKISVKSKNDQKNTDTACSKKLFLQYSLNVGIAGLVTSIKS